MFLFFSSYAFPLCFSFCVHALSLFLDDFSSFFLICKNTREHKLCSYALLLYAVEETPAMDPVHSCLVLYDTQRNMRKGIVEEQEDDKDDEEDEEPA